MINIQKGDIALAIEEPGEGYGFSRFDWTGKIIQMTYRGIPFCTDETLRGDTMKMGRGFFNEFGIVKAIGYDEAAVSESFPKIGVGSLLKESEEPYDFFKSYKIHPFDFKVHKDENRLIIQCLNKAGKYPFFLEKEILVHDSGFEIHYKLDNRGDSTFSTSEYTHNFLSPGGRAVGEETSLVFNGKIDAFQFGKGVNPLGIMSFKDNQVHWDKTPTADFFYENICCPGDGERVWTLSNKNLSIGIGETVDFQPSKINLWGAAHVVSPEVFKDIRIDGGQSDHWCRNYSVFTL